MGHYAVNSKRVKEAHLPGDDSTPTELSRSPGLSAQKSYSGEVKLVQEKLLGFSSKT